MDCAMMMMNSNNISSIVNQQQNNSNNSNNHMNTITNNNNSNHSNNNSNNRRVQRYNMNHNKNHHASPTTATATFKQQQQHWRLNPGNKPLIHETSQQQEDVIVVAPPPPPPGAPAPTTTTTTATCTSSTHATSSSSTSQTTTTTTSSPKKRHNSRAHYTDHLSAKEVNRGLLDGTLFKGQLRINAFDRNEAYVTAPDVPSEHDVYIYGENARNRALDGDIVIIALNPEKQWRKRDKLQQQQQQGGGGDNSSALQPTGKVVAIAEKLRKENIVGVLKPARDTDSSEESTTGGGMINSGVVVDQQFVYFVPVDRRYPRIMIPTAQCPLAFIRNPVQWQKELFVASIVKWTASSALPMGQLKQHVGKSGQFETEINCLLIQSGLQYQDIDDVTVNNNNNNNNNKSNSNNSNGEWSSFRTEDGDHWSIPATEFERRQDLRPLRIFSIDPASCKDVDDAVSITKLVNNEDNGDATHDLYEIGVHIADVSHFVKPGSAIDLEARHRATSAYILNKVVHMLPRTLSETICSLNQGVDRLAFSVFFHVNDQGQVMPGSARFTKSIIHNCCKMSYETADAIVEGHIAHATDIPRAQQPSNNQSGNELIKDVLLLSHITGHMKKKRYERGLLNIINDEYEYHFDEQGQPSHISKKKHMRSFELIEELMLLTNSIVAHYFVSQTKNTVLRDYAILRNHKSPSTQRLGEFEKYCQEVAKVQLVDTSHVSTLNRAIHSVYEQNNQLGALLFYQVRRVMNHADYVRFSTLHTNTNNNNGVDSSQMQFDSDMYHYGLNMPCYTHFTSPIRRYSDLMAHRLLSSLVCSTPFPHTPEQVDQILSVCNKKRLDAKRVEEMSQKVFLTDVLSNSVQQHKERGIICGLNQKNLIVYFPGINSELRVPFEDIQSLVKKRTHKRKEKKIVISWIDENAPCTTFSMLDTVECVLYAKESSEGQIEIAAKLNYSTEPNN